MTDDKRLPGRPTIAAGVGVLGVRFTAAQRLYLERVASDRGIRLAEVVREAVDYRREERDARSGE